MSEIVAYGTAAVIERPAGVTGLGAARLACCCRGRDARRRGASSPPARMSLGWRLALLGLLLVVAALFERWRYKRLGSTHPGSDWVATDERFIDPESGKLVTVYYRPATGERRYIAG